MPNIDETAQVGLELLFTSAKVTAKVIMAIMELFLKEEDRQPYYEEFKTKQGKQNLKDLFTKYENSSIQSLGNNITTEEKKHIQKELKQMGVDFSVRKVGKDNYSLFFAGKDIEAIEKGLENAINKFAIKEQKKGRFSKDNLLKNTKDKPSFSLKEVQERHKEIKQKDREEQTKVRDKKPSLNR